MLFNAEKTKMFLPIFLLSLIASILIIGRSTIVAASPTPSISMNPRTISGVMPGETFSIDITATGVTEWGLGLWGYQFILSYDTNVLTVTAYSSYDPFTLPWPSELNDPAGYVRMAYSMPLGTEEGKTGDITLAKIDFEVDALGASTLDLHDTIVTAAKPPTVDGQSKEEIDHVVIDGSFANVGDKMAVSPSYTTALVNETLHINITVAELAGEIWTYFFNLTYNTEILTATNVTSYDPFSIESFSEINNESGYVIGNYSVADGQGFSTFEPKPIARIEFMIVGNGRSTLELRNTKIYDKAGTPVPHQIIHGSFTNNHDIAVTNISASPLKLLTGRIVAINVTVQNQGDFPETFRVSLKYANISISEITNISLDSGAAEALSFVWNTANLGAGVYTLKATAILARDTEPLNNESAAVNIILGESQTMGVTLLMGLAIGTGVVVGTSATIYSKKTKKRTRVTW